MRLGGWVAAKAALAAFAAAAAAATLWLAVRRFGVAVGVGGLVVGAFYAAPPLTSYATQVYPEMPAALCLTLGLAAVTGPLARTGRVLAAASIVALPWLSVKFVPVAAVLGGRARRADCGQTVGARWLWTFTFLAVAGAAYCGLPPQRVRRLDRLRDRGPLHRRRVAGPRQRPRLSGTEPAPRRPAGGQGVRAGGVGARIPAGRVGARGAGPPAPARLVRSACGLRGRVRGGDLGRAHHARLVVARAPGCRGPPGGGGGGGRCWPIGWPRPGGWHWPAAW